MFNYPEAFDALVAKKEYPKSVEQFCSKCNAWYVVDQKAVKEAIEVWRDPKNDGMFPFQMCKCTNCGEKDILVMFGKYDKAKTRAKCAVQFWNW